MRLPRLLRGKRRAIFTRLVINGLAQAGAAMGIALLVRRAFERMSDTGPAALDRDFAFYLGALALAIGLSIVLRVIERIDAARLGENYVNQIRLRLFDALDAGPALAEERRGFGPTLLRFATDLTAVRQWVSEGLTRLIVASLAVAGGLVALVLIDPLMGLAPAGLSVLGVCIGAALSGALTTRIRDLRRIRARLASQVGDRLRTLAVVQVCGQARREKRILARNSARLAEAAVDRARVASIMRALPDAVIGLSTVAVLGIGALRLTAGDPSHGLMLAALSLLAAIAPQARALGRVHEYRRNYEVARAKLHQILSANPSRSAPRKSWPRDKMAGRLSFDTVSTVNSLSGVSADAEAGTVIAIMGPSGAGKSSLLAVAARLVPLEHGRVCIDGQDAQSFGAAEYARQIGMVSASLPLLKGSIRRNVAYRWPRADAEKITQALRAAGICESEIAALPNGLETRITETNRGLPSGLRRRLALARALLGPPGVLLLDDADLLATEPAGRKALDRLVSERRSTILMVTNDPQRARTADQIWVLENGRLIESGSPRRLLEKDAAAARCQPEERASEAKNTSKVVHFRTKDTTI